MKKHYVILLFTIFLFALCFSGCSKKIEIKNVSLTLWTSDREEGMTKDAIQEFIRIHKDEAKFDIQVEVVEIDNVKQQLLDSSQKSADVFHFASDQYTDLKRAGILSPIDYEYERVLNESGGSSASIVKEISEFGKLFAYPATKSNGYFLYYNKKFFAPNDVTTLDRILAVAAKNKKYFAMDWTSGWYLYSFFAAAGKTIKINSDATANKCDFNSTQGAYSGKDVANAMLKIARHSAFQSVDNDEMLPVLKEGNIIAVVNGTWNAQFFKELWGNDCGAVKLPTYTLNDDQLQMGSFAGYKYIGVNNKSKEKTWSMKIARWLTTYKYQMTRYKTTGECPANTDAASSYKVQISEPIAALNQQNQFATMQNVLDNYWKPMEEFGEIMIKGNPENRDLQELLDETVQKIEAP